VRVSITEKLEREDKRHVDVISYCLLPNHFHLLLKQLTDNGISKFVGNFQNSYTRYFNIRHDLQGALFIPQFKAVLVETEEQLLHLSRYIHLNPYTSALVNPLGKVIDYPYSSFGGVLGKRKDKIITGANVILSHFKNKNGYKEFTLKQADYQKRLHKIKHLLLED
jgi:putative transposase